MDSLERRIGGIKAIVLATAFAGVTLLSGCINGEYNKVTKMPEACKNQTIVGAGFEFSTYGTDAGAYDIISCKDSEGNVTIYRQKANSTEWYKTEIRR